VQTLSSADIDDVPVIVRFLLQTVTPADAQMVLNFSYSLHTLVFICLVAFFQVSPRVFHCPLDSEELICANFL